MRLQILSVCLLHTLASSAPAFGNELEDALREKSILEQRQKLLLEIEKSQTDFEAVYRVEKRNFDAGFTELERNLADISRMLTTMTELTAGLDSLNSSAESKFDDPAASSNDLQFKIGAMRRELTPFCEDDSIALTYESSLDQVRIMKESLENLRARRSSLLFSPEQSSLKSHIDQFMTNTETQLASLTKQVSSYANLVIRPPQCAALESLSTFLAIRDTFIEINRVNTKLENISGSIRDFLASAKTEEEQNRQLREFRLFITGVEGRYLRASVQGNIAVILHMQEHFTQELRSIESALASWPQDHLGVVEIRKLLKATESRIFERTTALKLDSLDGFRTLFLARAAHVHSRLTKASLVSFEGNKKTEYEKVVKSVKDDLGISPGGRLKSAVKLSLSNLHEVGIKLENAVAALDSLEGP